MWSLAPYSYTGLVIVYGLLAYYCYKFVKLVRFCCSSRADADLRLLSKSRPPPDCFNNRSVWIVGASQGLGQELAIHFAKLGADVVLSARNLQQLEHVKQQCDSFRGGQASILPLDATWPVERLREAAQNVGDMHAGIDYLVYAAGASQHARVEEADPAVVQQLFALNLLGAVHFASAVLPQMITRRQGRFVIISSMAACVPTPGQSAYAACKAGLNAYFEALSCELSERGVGVSICCPGPVAGQPGVTRSLYGPHGLITEPSKAGGSSSSHMHPSRVAALIVQAVYHKVPKCWIAKHPVLLIGYLNQYMPKAAFAIMQAIGPGRVASFEHGRGGYNFVEVVKRAVRASKSC